MAHDHYKKDVSHLDMLDVYRVLALFNVTNPCIQHAVKKLLVTGGRGGAKDFDKDIQDVIDTLTRLQDMVAEDCVQRPSIGEVIQKKIDARRPHGIDAEGGR